MIFALRNLTPAKGLAVLGKVLPVSQMSKRNILGIWRGFESHALKRQLEKIQGKFNAEMYPSWFPRETTSGTELDYRLREWMVERGLIDS